MPLTLKEATRADIAVCVPLRLEVLRAANGLPPNAPLPAAETAALAYYEACLGTPAYVELHAFLDGGLAGCGAASIYTVMPTCHNPSGKKAYIMNMYTLPAHRRQGIARQILDALVQRLRAMGITHIALEATAMGRPLYEAYGFVRAEDEMLLP